MKRLGTIDLEILHLAINQNGTFNESHLENSKLKRLGVGKLLDCLATLKDRKMLSLNNTDGSFSITDLAKEILWGKDVPTWAKVLRLLQIKSCSMDEITDILRVPREQLDGDIEELRKNQLVLMSPQRQGEKLLKVFEILPEGVQYIDKTDVDGFDSAVFGEPRPQIEVISKIDEIVKETPRCTAATAAKGLNSCKTLSAKRQVRDLIILYGFCPVSAPV